MNESAHNSASCAVIGGGILGMTLALRIAERGHRVALFEAAPHFGGLADAWQLGDVWWDRHYHVTLSSDHYLLSLLTELGLSDDLVFSTTRTGFHTGGQTVSVSNGWEFLRFPHLNAWDKVRLAATIWRAVRIGDLSRLDDETVSEWLIRVSGQRVYDRFWKPLLRSKLGENVERTSAVFIATTINRLVAARQTGVRQREQFGYVRGGYRRVVAALVKTLSVARVALHPGTGVRYVGRDGSDQLLVHSDDGKPHRFDHVVVTTPAPVAASICTELTPSESQRLRGVAYQGILCGSVLLRRPLQGFYVTNIADETLPFTGVIEMTTLVRPEHLGGHHLIYLPKYVPAQSEAFLQSDAYWERRLLDGLKRMVPDLEDRDVAAFRLSRARHVAALPTCGYSRRVPPLATSVPGLSIVSSAQILDGTLNVNETIRLAETSLPDLLTRIEQHASPSSTRLLDVRTDRELVTRPR